MNSCLKACLLMVDTCILYNNKYLYNCLVLNQCWTVLRFIPNNPINPNALTVFRREILSLLHWQKARLNQLRS